MARLTRSGSTSSTASNLSSSSANSDCSSSSSDSDTNPTRVQWGPQRTPEKNWLRRMRKKDSREFVRRQSLGWDRSLRDRLESDSESSSDEEAEAGIVGQEKTCFSADDGLGEEDSLQEASRTTERPSPTSPSNGSPKPPVDDSVQDSGTISVEAPSDETFSLPAEVVLERDAFQDETREDSIPREEEDGPSTPSKSAPPSSATSTSPTTLLDRVPNFVGIHVKSEPDEDSICIPPPEEDLAPALESDRSDDPVDSQPLPSSQVLDEHPSSESPGPTEDSPLTVDEPILVVEQPLPPVAVPVVKEEVEEFAIPPSPARLSLASSTGTPSRRESHLLLSAPSTPQHIAPQSTPPPVSPPNIPSPFVSAVMIKSEPLDEPVDLSVLSSISIETSPFSEAFYEGDPPQTGLEEVELSTSAEDLDPALASTPGPAEAALDEPLDDLPSQEVSPAVVEVQVEVSAVEEPEILPMEESAMEEADVLQVEKSQEDLPSERAASTPELPKSSESAVVETEKSVAFPSESQGDAERSEASIDVSTVFAQDVVVDEAAPPPTIEAASEHSAGSSADLPLSTVEQRLEFALEDSAAPPTVEAESPVDEVSSVSLIEPASVPEVILCEEDQAEEDATAGLDASTEPASSLPPSEASQTISDDMLDTPQAPETEDKLAESADLAPDVDAEDTTAEPAPVQEPTAKLDVATHSEDDAQPQAEIVVSEEPSPMDDDSPSACAEESVETSVLILEEVSVPIDEEVTLEKVLQPVQEASDGASSDQQVISEPSSTVGEEAIPSGELEAETTIVATPSPIESPAAPSPLKSSLILDEVPSSAVVLPDASVAALSTPVAPVSSPASPLLSTIDATASSIPELPVSGSSSSTPVRPSTRSKMTPPPEVHRAAANNRAPSARALRSSPQPESVPSALSTPPISRKAANPPSERNPPVVRSIRSRLTKTTSGSSSSSTTSETAETQLPRPSPHTSTIPRKEPGLPSPMPRSLRAPRIPTSSRLSVEDQPSSLPAARKPLRPTIAQALETPPPPAVEPTPAPAPKRKPLQPSSAGQTPATRAPRSRKPAAVKDVNPVDQISDVKLQSMTLLNTRNNQAYFSPMEKIVVRKEGQTRPESPGPKVTKTLPKSSLGKGRALFDPLPEEGEAESDEEIPPTPKKHVRGPGDVEDYESPMKSLLAKGKGKTVRGFAHTADSEGTSQYSVRWNKGLVLIKKRNSTAPEPQHRILSSGPKPAIKPVPPLDAFGNYSSGVPLNQLIKRSLVTYTKIIYDDDLPPPPAAKKGKR